MKATPTPDHDACHRVLVIDDEPLVRDVLTELFSSQGYTVQVASDGAEAERIFMPQTCAAALVDLRIPGDDGIRILDLIRRIDPTISVILMTGYPTLESAIAALQHGAFSYIIKPFRLGQLLDIVQEATAATLKTRRGDHLSRRLNRLEQTLREHGIAIPDQDKEAAVSVPMVSDSPIKPHA